MAQAQIYTGSWEELSVYAAAFHGRKDLTLIVPDSSPAEKKQEMTPEEKIRALDALAEKNRHYPALPSEAFDRENLYEERR